MAITEKHVSSLAAGGGNGDSYATAWTLTEAFANAVAGHRVNVWADGTYTRTASDTPANAGTSTSPIIYRGCKNAIGNGYQGRTNGNGPLITTNMPSIAYNSTFRLTTTGAFTVWESLNISGLVSTAVIAQGTDSVLCGCKVNNASTNAGAAGVAPSSRSIVFNNDVELTGASGGGQAINGGAVRSRIIANRIKGGPGIGISLSTAENVIIVLNTIFASGGNHIVVTATGGSPVIVLNSLVGGSADAIDIVTGNTVLQCIIGNMITDNAGYGIDLNNAAVAAFLAYNRTRDNTLGATHLGDDWVAATSFGHVTTDTGGPETDYQDSAGNDYRLIGASPAKAAGVPQHLDIGALQRAEGGGGANRGIRTGGVL